MARRGVGAPAHVAGPGRARDRAGRAGSGQERQAKSPFLGDARAISEGQAMFRSGCAMCHGTDAQGGLKGPNLVSGRFTHGGTDADLFRTITQGVPGTLMMPSDMSEERTWKIIAFLRSLKVRDTVPVDGDRANGEALFFGRAACASCHIVNGRGGRLGPELSSIGSSRSPEFVRDKIRNPNDLGKGATLGLWWELGQPLLYQHVTLVTRGGARVVGTLRNEDTYSIQLMDTDQQLRTFQKKDLQQLTHEPSSLMPAYDAQALPDKDLRDVIAYVDSLREPPKPVKP